jgi:redox-sensitive bicupin YhaK (pirin superfamily)
MGSKAGSPASVLSPTLYVHAKLEAGASLMLDDEHEERAAYVVEGNVTCDDVDFEAGHLLVLRRGVVTTFTTKGAARVMLIGGARLDGERHIFWNFVSSSEARLAQAKSDWRDERFPKVPGDSLERIPLPK